MIRYLEHSEIDQTKWDQCILQSRNSLIYGFSWYLNAMAPGWNALVQDDYEAVMPVPTVKKLFTMAYQPFFMQQLGVFFNGETSNATVKDFLSALPNHFRYINICLNEANDTSLNSCYQIIGRNNYLLHLHQSYEELKKGYSDQTKRNLNKALKNSLQLIASTGPEVVSFYQVNKSEDTIGVKPEHYEQFKKVLEEAEHRKFVHFLKVVTPKGDVLAQAAFYFYKNRIVYQMGASSEEGKTVHAMTYLFDNLIRKHANQNLLLDFEGSDINSVARFFNGFGSLCTRYNRVIYNNLPWPFNIIKK